MRRLLALFQHWFTREHAICLGAIFLCGLVSAGPAALERAAPVAFPQTLAVPEIGEGLITDPVRTAEYRTARTIQSYQLLREAGRGNGSILWNPREFAGTPFLAAWDTRVFSPFSLPFFLFDIEIAVHIAALMKVFVAGVLAYYASRVLGLTHPFSLFVAIAHALSGPLTVWTIDPASDTAAWVPLLFLFAERLSLAQYRYWPAGAVIVGVMLLSGAPQAVLSSFVFFAAYFQLRRRVETVREFISPIASGVAAALLGVGIASAQIWPYVEWLRESTPIWAQGEAGVGPRAMYLPFGPLAGLNGADPAAVPLHLGLVPLFLATLWVVVRRYIPEGQCRRIDALLIVSVVWLGAGLLLTALQPVVPFLQVVLVRHLVAPVAFSVALGAAASAEAWLQLRPSQSIEAAKRYVGVLVLLLILVAAAYVSAASRGFVSNALRQDTMIAALTVCVYVLVLGITLVRPWPRMMGYILAGATALQLMLCFVPMQPRTPWERVFADPFEGARETPGQRIAFGPRTQSAGRLALNTPTVQGFGPRAPKRMAAYLLRAHDDPLLLPAAGVSEFVLTLDDMNVGFSNLRPQLQLVGVSEFGVGLFEYVPGAQMARMIFDGRIVDRFDPKQLRSEGPPLIEHAVSLAPPEGRPGRPIVRNDGEATRRTVNVYRTDPGVLALAESYYPDWYARVDNTLSPTFPVDGAFRGIEVPAGSREVTFIYRPDSYRWGRAVSFATLSLCLLGLAHLTYFRLRNQFFKL